MFFVKVLFPLLICSTLPLKSKQSCEHARLKVKPILIDDCELVNDKLYVRTQLTGSHHTNIASAYQEFIFQQLTIHLVLTFMWVEKRQSNFQIV